MTSAQGRARETVPAPASYPRSAGGTAGLLISDAAVPIEVHVTEQRNLRPDPTVETYDFRRPMTLAREHSRAIEVAGETFARQWGTQLTSRLRVVCGVALESVQMISYDEYIATLADQTLMAVGSVEKGRSTAVLEVPVELALLWIDYLLGGPGLRGVAKIDAGTSSIAWSWTHRVVEWARLTLFQWGL